MYILIMTLSKIKSEDKEITPSQNILINSSYKDIENKAMEFFEYHTGAIEIFFQNKLHKVIFPIQPCCRNLSKNTRTLLMEEVNRESSNSKITVKNNKKL